MLPSGLAVAAPLIEALGWALVHSIWQCAAIWLVVQVLLASMRSSSATARYAACTLGVLAMALAPAITFFSLAGTPAGWLDFDAPVAAAGSAAGQGVHAARVDSAVLPWLVLAWLSGVVFLLARLAAGWRQIHRLRRRALRQPVCEWQGVAETIARRLRLSRAVRVVETAAASVPVVIGWLRPVILLPVRAMTGLTREQIELVLAHELAHIRRHDFLLNAFQSVVESLLFYHPAVWWVSRRMREEREFCCDDLAVSVCGDPVSYARMLTELETLRGPAAALVLASNGGDLMHRVSRLLRLRTAPRRLGAACCGACCAVCLMVCAAGGAYALHAPLPVDDQPAVPEKAELAAAEVLAGVWVRAVEAECAAQTDEGDAAPQPALRCLPAGTCCADTYRAATALAQLDLGPGEFELSVVPEMSTSQWLVTSDEPGVNRWLVVGEELATVDLEGDFATVVTLHCDVAQPEETPAPATENLIDLIYEFVAPEALGDLGCAPPDDGQVACVMAPGPAAPCSHVVSGDLAACEDACASATVNSLVLLQPAIAGLAADGCATFEWRACAPDGLQAEGEWTLTPPNVVNAGRLMQVVLTPNLHLEGTEGEGTVELRIVTCELPQPR